MKNLPGLDVMGIPDFVPAPAAAACRSRLIEVVQELMERSGLEEINVLVGTPAPSSSSARRGSLNPKGKGQIYNSLSGGELSVQERALQYRSRPPLFDFDFLVVPGELEEDLLSAVDLVRLEGKVFDEWNLRKIEPFPRMALNFHGPPGTGKTLAAHALARYAGTPILAASYAQIESKYHGEGPKNVEALFYAAQRDGALLFVDEADSLLSKRLVNVTHGAEHAINSIRSQLLVSLERFRGVAVFATNFIESYDRAFETRLRHIYFPMPDAYSRREIWRRHLPPELPLAADVCLDELAAVEGICGRDIKNAVIDVALRAARSGRNVIAGSDLVRALERIKAARPDGSNRSEPRDD